MEQIYIVPAPSLKVRDPATSEYLPESGSTVALTPYWHRRLTDGDVVQTKHPAPQPPAATQTKPAKGDK